LALTPGTRLGAYEVIAQIGAGGMRVDAGVLHVPGILDLANFGLRVIIPDQPGHGQSDRGSQSEYSHRTWAVDANELAGGPGLCHGLHYSATGEPQALAGSEDSTSRGFEHAQLTQRKRRCELFLRQARFSWC
jgi:hypothetical protein